MKEKINEANELLKELEDYKECILNEVQGNSLKKPISDYYRLLEMFEEDLKDCINLYNRKELTEFGRIQMSWLIDIFKSVI